MNMRRLVGAVLGVGAVLVLPVTAAWAGNPHFVGAPVATISGAAGETLTVSAKEAGLGDEAQIHVVLTATASCINGGGNHPKAVNKASFSAAADEPVQNGKADYAISVTATFQPDCSPPMTVVWSEIVLTDTTNGLTVAL